jgi:oxygen-independent coproporphyrinogen-3 oxidase
MTPDLIKRYAAAALPRYTSYPTANHFNDAVGPSEYRAWLEDLPQNANLSLYVHIPYCQQLCWYCGCSTKATQRYEPVDAYVNLLEREIGTLAALAPHQHHVSHIHWGGGSPDILKPYDILKLAAALRSVFYVDDAAEFAVEIDPRLLSRDQADAFAEAGINRVSIGVQDFDPRVQKAIGREQSFDATRHTVDLFRDRGIASVNIDLVYGLPHQTEESVSHTIEKVLQLAPDRIAIFGYAHLPSRLKHQRLIDEAALPGSLQRFAQSQRLERILLTEGYRKIGLDHFARATDTMAAKPLARNFQGYTTDQADALIGIGASSISKLPQGFAQNAIAVDDYGRRLETCGLATARGRALTTDDRIRADVIERLMCDFTFSAAALEARYGAQAKAVLSEAEAIAADDEDAFIERTREGFRLTETGRPFVRNICARFDAYLPADIAARRHAPAV